MITALCAGSRFDAPRKCKRLGGVRCSMFFGSLNPSIANAQKARASNALL